MFFRRIATISTSVILAALLTACSDGFGVIDSGFEGTYALMAVNGNSALPVTTYQNDEEQFSLLADTLRFKADGSVQRTQIARAIVNAPWLTQDSVVRHSYTMHYRIAHNDLAIGYFDPCPDTAMCIGPEEGTVTSVAITLRSN